MKRRGIFITLAFVLAIMTTAVIAVVMAANEPVLPYNISNNFGQDASRELVVQWHNNSGISTQKLQITSKADESFASADEVIVSGEEFLLSGDFGTYPARNVYRAYVDDLMPDTEYIYRVGTDGLWSEVFNYTTAGVSTNFSFTVVSDPQSGEFSRMLTTMNTAIAYDADNKFFLNGGDLVDEIGRRPAEIAQYTKAANEINKYVPIAATQGNHDTYSTVGEHVYRWGEARAFNAHVAFPKNGSEQDITKCQSYYFYYNNLLVIMLNGMADDTQHTSQIAWLRNLLAHDREEGLSQYTVAVTHTGLFGNKYYEDGYMRKMRERYGKVFSDYDVDIVFSGHDHTYARTNPIKIEANGSVPSYAPTDNGTIYSIAGSTGPKFYDGTTNPAADTTTFAVRSKTISEVNSGVFVNLKVTATELTVIAKTVSGTVLDSYVVDAKRGWSTDPRDSVRVVSSANINSAKLTLLASGVEDIAKIELARAGYDAAEYAVDTRTFELDGLRAGSSYTYEMKVTFTDGETKQLKVTFSTRGFLEKRASDYIAIVGNHNAEKFKVYVNGDFLLERSLDKIGCKIPNTVAGGSYLIRVELIGSDGQIVATDHTFISM